ncbi:hypothetical protein IEQ34_002246 [Dendrobium chrysotoxum]|uniref:Uncharacterized protein n=1 Tax=Dendrobium chrysotoxum TaxID=161865 RepID=A0AAV7HLC8_DENCH|nr:hypothetical protein IEQ34_002246 [Dendrobium chrysotoxum]
MTKETGTIRHRLSRFIRAPLRRARDYYVRSMTDLAGRMHYGAAAVGMSYPCICATEVPRSYNLSAAQLSNVDEELRDLIRFASRRRPDFAAGEAARRSRSRAEWRIDEEWQSDFVGEVRVGESLILPRRRKYAVGAVVPV